MRHSRRWVGALVVGALLTQLVGCTRPLKEQVVGKWKHVGSAAHVEFLKDGTLVWAIGPLQASGTFATPDEKHVRTELKGAIGAMLGSQTYEAKVRKDTLELMQGTQPMQFTRVK